MSVSSNVCVSAAPVTSTCTLYAIVSPGATGDPLGGTDDLATETSGAPILVDTLLEQCAAAGQVESPPPEAVAVFVTPGVAAAVGVTGITKLVLAPAANPVATVQVTVWPAAVQPAGRVPSVSPVGIVSLIVADAVVAALPLLVSCRV
ncbi:MAG: hypothetical protein ABT27_21680 [Lysobacteraceae bacterium SCN 69-25]|nr:MAG: hypothetical protein ABT27_21680 [Xanthomonadaceae bacterium SCN 69-25]